MSTKEASILFDDDTQKQMKEFVDKNIKTISQKQLIQYITNASWENAAKAKRSGSRSVRYCPLMI